jgi:hypothetical protein
MAILRKSTPIDRQYVERLLVATAPERVQEMLEIWDRYNPGFFIAVDGPGVLMQANKERVVFDQKTLAIYWLVGFAAWRVLECYSPAVLSALPVSGRPRIPCLLKLLLAITNPFGRPIADTLVRDAKLVDIEGRFQDLLYDVRNFVKADEITEGAWPSGIPLPGADRTALKDRQEQAAFDLACMSTAYAFCHELRHVMFAKDGDAPAQRPEEELACDRWAREFLTERTQDYAKAYAVRHDLVLGKRSMAAAVATLVLYETTERHGDAGTDDYPPLADRIDATVGKTALSSDSPFWVTYASVLLAILRRRGRSPAIQATDGPQLCARLLEAVRVTS